MTTFIIACGIAFAAGVAACAWFIRWLMADEGDDHIMRDD